MTRYITVTLTEKEAGAVIGACVNSTMDIADTPGNAYMKAACRAAAAALVITRCLDCGAVASRIIPMDIPIYCHTCGSDKLSW